MASDNEKLATLVNKLRVLRSNRLRLIDNQDQLDPTLFAAALNERNNHITYVEEQKDALKATMLHTSDLTRFA